LSSGLKHSMPRTPQFFRPPPTSLTAPTSVSLRLRQTRRDSCR